MIRSIFIAATLFFTSTLTLASAIDGSELKGGHPVEGGANYYYGGEQPYNYLEAWIWNNGEVMARVFVDPESFAANPNEGCKRAFDLARVAASKGGFKASSCHQIGKCISRQKTPPNRAPSHLVRTSCLISEK